MRRLIILIISLFCLLSGCKKNDEKEQNDENEQISLEALNPSLLPNKALVDFTTNDLYLNNLSYFIIDVNYLPQTEISIPNVENAYLKYDLFYSLTYEKDEFVIDYEIQNDSALIFSIKHPPLPNDNFTFQIIVKWQKKTDKDGSWVECSPNYNEILTKTVLTGYNPASLNPDLLPNPALVDFTETEKNCDIASSFIIDVNYLPKKEIRVTQFEQAYLTYDLYYTLTGDEGEVEMGYEILNHSQIILGSLKPLENNKNYSLQVFAKWKKKFGVNGNWEACSDEYDNEISQTIITNLPLNDLSINQSDFVFQYPLDRQFNYLEDEYPKGYFKLKSEKQKELMYYNGLIRIRNVKTGVGNKVQLTYNENLDVFEYDLQANFLENETVYEISILTKDTEELVYAYYFKTSKYNSFSEKWDILKLCIKGKWRDNVSDANLPYSNVAYGNANYLQKINVSIDEEILDYYESNANRYSSSDMPLIQLETHVPDEWKTTSEWNIYSWNSLTYIRQNTDSKKYGFPPLRAIYFAFNEQYAIKLSDASITGNIDYPVMPFEGIMIWEVQNFMIYDALSAYINARNINENQRDEYQNIAAGNYENMDRLWLDFVFGDDKYPLVDIYYFLPGINIETTKISDFQL